MTNRTALIVAVVLAVVHLVLAGIYASITPYRAPGILLGQGKALIPDIGAPDERQHANYVKHLLDGKGFPVFNPQDPNLSESYQSHQPPLFYILEAGWTKITGADLESRNDGVKVRLLNTLIGASTVLGVFFLGLWAFKRPEVGLIAAAFVALLPMNTALSGAVSNDPLLYAICTWSLALIAKGCVEGWSLKLAIAVGALVGLGMLTKTTAISLLPILLLAVFLGPNKPSGKQIAVCAGLIAILAGPWLLRNQSNYGDPLALKAFNEAFGGSAAPADVAVPGLMERSEDVANKVSAFAAQHPELQGRDLLRSADKELNLGSNHSVHYWSDWVGWWTFRSFFGAFGYMDIFLNEHGDPFTNPKNPNTLYRLLLALTFGTLASWALAFRKPEWSEHKKVHILLGVFLAIVVLLFARFNTQYFQGQARYLFPAIGVVGIGVAIAALNITKNRWQAALALVLVILGVLNIYGLSRLPAEFERRTTGLAMGIQTEHGGPSV